MNRRIESVAIILGLLILSGVLAWALSSATKSVSSNPGIDGAATSQTSVLAYDNKMISCRKCRDHGLMKYKVTSVSLCNKRGSRYHRAVNANRD